MQKCVTAPKWIFHRPANAGLLRGMQLGRISQTSTSSCWLADADQRTEDNHGSKNAPQTTSKNCSRLLCAPTLCNTHAFHISLQIRKKAPTSITPMEKTQIFVAVVDVVTFLHPENLKSVYYHRHHHRKPENLFHALKLSSYLLTNHCKVTRDIRFWEVRCDL